MSHLLPWRAATIGRHPADVLGAEPVPLVDEVPDRAADVAAWIAQPDDPDARAWRAAAAREVEEARGEPRKSVVAAIEAAGG